MEKKTVKIGRLSLGVLLVLLGISIIIGIFDGALAVNILFRLWPVILICLGIETLYYNYKKNIESKFDASAIILMFILIGAISIFNAVTYYFKTAVKELNLSNQVEAALIYDEETFYMEANNLTIENLSEKAKIKKIDVTNSNKIKVHAKYEYNNIFRRDTILEIYGSDKLTIEGNNDMFIDNLEVVVYVPQGANVNIIENN